MKNKSKYLGTALQVLALSVINSAVSTAFAQGSAFTYQGRLIDGGAPANGNYDVQFILYSASVGGNQVGPILTNASTPLSSGLFTVTLDFGAGLFNGSNYWLDLAVRTNGSGAFTELSPRQAVTPVPYAVFARTSSNISGTISSGNFSGAYGSAVTLNNAGNSFTGGFIGNGGGLTNLNAWGLLGNNGTAGGVNYLGTGDNQPFEIHVNGTRIMRLEPDPRGANAGNIIGGFPGNTVEQPGSGSDFIGSGGYPGIPNIVHSNSSGVSIGGGSLNQIGPNVNDAVIAGGFGNTIQVADSVIGGGSGNVVQGGADHSTIPGGYNNQIQSNAYDSVVGGGYGNIIGPTAQFAVIAGGNVNLIQPNNYHAVIGGGSLNTIWTNANDSVIAGGYGNLIEIYANNGVIAGGYTNDIQPYAAYSFIGGGLLNFIQSNAVAAVIGGGQANTNGGLFSSLGGGVYNFIAAYDTSVTLGGGYQNMILHDSYDATLSGGQSNLIAAFGAFATIGGGQGNFVSSYSGIIGGGFYNSNTSSYGAIGGGKNNISGGSGLATVSGGYSNNASGYAASIPGGQQNLASGNYALAAGQNAQATNQGAFVWADSQGAPFSSTASDQFLVRAQGGVGIGATNPAAQLHIVSSGGSALPQVRVDQTLSNDFARVRFRTATNYIWDVAVGGGAASVMNFFVARNPSVTGTNILTLNPNGTATLYGTLTQGSDRARKENFQVIDPGAVLDKVAHLPITAWNYKEDPATQHLGPMAQDFHAAFGLNGDDDKHIAVVDEDGVALAAIQGLNQKLQEKDAEILTLRQQNDSIAGRLQQLELAVKALADKKTTP